MLASVVDRTGGGGTDDVRRAFERVEAQLAARGWTIGRPVSVEIVRMPIMGATTSKPRGHTLYVSERARDGGTLEGLIAHEAGHMLLTEAGHPSHDPRVVRRIWTRLRLPDRGRQAFGQAYNHVQDIYADDIALLTDLGERAYAFFSDWVKGNADARPSERWARVALSASTGFALGNLVRHERMAADDELWRVARAADRRAGPSSVDAFSRYFSALPPDPSPAGFESAVGELIALLSRAAARRPESRTF